MREIALMNLSVSDFYFYGGMALCVVCLIMILVLIPVFAKKRKKLIREIESGDKKQRGDRA